MLAMIIYKVGCHSFIKFTLTVDCYIVIKPINFSHVNLSLKFFSFYPNVTIISDV